MERTMKKRHHAKPALPAQHMPKAFCADTAGSMSIFAGFLILSTLAVTAIGLDLMRLERERMVLQNTLDRAVLAAADMEQPLSPEAVVRSYLEKAGVGNALTQVNVLDSAASRRVTAAAEHQVPTLLLHLLGVDTWTVSGASQAREDVENIEISLVLDISGSMNGRSKLTNLKIAAKEFIDQVFSNSTPGTVTVSIIPYASQVALPAELFDELTLEGENAHAQCINWSDESFDSVQIDVSEEYQRTLHFSQFGGNDLRPERGMFLWPECYPDTNREAILMASNPDTLKDFIDGLSANGNTAIDMGVKWGAILLDPSFQPLAQSLAGSSLGTIHPDHANRPVPYGEDTTMKIVILMTDGQNTSRTSIHPNFRTGDSPVWWNEQEQKYSIYLGLDSDDRDGDGITEEPLFYWVDVDQPDAPDGSKPTPWKNHAYGNGTHDVTVTSRTCTSWDADGLCPSYNTMATTAPGGDPGTAVNLSYPELWEYTSRSVVEGLYREFMSASQASQFWSQAIQTAGNRSAADARAVSVCSNIKGQGVNVYTIAFEASHAGTELLKSCASSDSHHFDVKGLEISDAFGTIASSIRALRLTQ